MIKLKKTLAITIITIILAGCSKGSELFSMLATSDVEMAAGDQISNAEKKQVRIDLVKAKIAAFPQHALLEAKNPNDYQGVSVAALRNDFNQDEKTLIEIESFLPSITQGEYVGWLTTPANQNIMEIGNIQEDQQGYYTLSYESTENTSQFTQIAISYRENESQDLMATEIFRGTFTTQKPQSKENN